MEDDEDDEDDTAAEYRLGQRWGEALHAHRMAAAWGGGERARCASGSDHAVSDVVDLRPGAALCGSVISLAGAREWVSEAHVGRLKFHVCVRAVMSSGKNALLHMA